MCFSPPVMVATFVIEICMAVYAVVRYRMAALSRLVVITLFSLAVFQLSEYFVCGGAGLSAMHWSRLGYAAITTLPPLGLHILHILAHKPGRKLVLASYGIMFGLVLYFLLIPTAFSGYQCTGNYVIFQLTPHVGGWYTMYYYSWLAIAILLGMRWLGKATKREGRKIQALIIGYLVFLVPTAVVNSIDPSTRRGIPSIMCGFAVIFAFILTIYILPNEQRRKKT